MIKSKSIKRIAKRDGTIVKIDIRMATTRRSEQEVGK